MKGLEKNAMNAEYTRSIPKLQSAGRSASVAINNDPAIVSAKASGERSGSLGSNERFGMVDIFTMSTFSPSSFGSENSALWFGSTMGGNWFQCPITVPFCERQSCTSGYDSTNSNAFACYTKPGCCFDQVLYQHRLAFGQNFFKRFREYSICLW